MYVFFIQQSRLNSLQPLRSSQWANSGLGIKTPSIWLALPRLFQMPQLPGGIEIAKSTEKLSIEITRFTDMDPDLISLLLHWISNIMDGKQNLIYFLHTVFPHIVYSFLNLEIQRSQYIRPKVTIHKGAETIQGRKLFKGWIHLYQIGR